MLWRPWWSCPTSCCPSLAASAGARAPWKTTLMRQGSGATAGCSGLPACLPACMPVLPAHSPDCLPVCPAVTRPPACWTVADVCLPPGLHSLQTLTTMQSNWEEPTMAIENRWRFIPIAGRAALAGWLSLPVPCRLACSGAGACLFTDAQPNLHPSNLPLRLPLLLPSCSRVWHHACHRAAVQPGLLAAHLVPHSHRPHRPAVARHRTAHAAGRG